MPKKIHLATIWLMAIGTTLSAYMILAANAWMEHPVGYQLNSEKDRAEMTDVGNVMFQDTAVVAWFHTLSAAFLTVGAFVAAISLWLVMKDRGADEARKTLKVGAITALAAFIVVAISGDQDAKIMVKQQPMKMAAAEALYETSQPAPFSLFTIGTLDGSEPIFSLDVPGLLSFLATGSWDGEVQGINDLEAQSQEQYGAQFTDVESFMPVIPVTYWGFRLMIGLGALVVLTTDVRYGGSAWSR